MTADQQSLYEAAMEMGADFGVGGISTWTYYPPSSGDGVTSAPTLTSSGTVAGYVMEVDLSKYGQPLPPQLVGVIGYRFNGFLDTVIAVGAVIKSGAYIFSIGPLDSNMGWPTAIVTPTGAP